MIGAPSELVIAMNLVVVALIGGPITVLAHRYDKRNTSQHADNKNAAAANAANIQEAIERVGREVGEVKGHVLTHLSWHVTQEQEKLKP